MEKKKNYTFGEKQQEYSVKQGKNIDVWISPKYLETKAKVIEMLEKFDYLDESDFWILMNETRTGKMGYTGLIISHNGCLKINDNAKEEDRFNPESVIEDKDGFNGSLTFKYCNKQQGIYEIGEVSTKNCKNDYPYAMAFKRLFDRVVLKISKLAFYGVYSDSEADEFKEKQDDSTTPTNDKEDMKMPIQEGQKQIIAKLKPEALKKLLDEKYKVESIDDLTWNQAREIEIMINNKLNKERKKKEEVF